MSKFSKLLRVTEEEKKAILEYFNVDENGFNENVQLIKDWACQCEHLPRDIDENFYRLCLITCKLSVERSKQLIENYYRVRTLYSNEIFDKLLPNTQQYTLAKTLVKTAALPKLTPDLCRITVFKLFDPDGEATDASIYNMIVLMMAELRIKNDLFISNIIIMDFEGYGWKNLIKFTPAYNQKMLNILNAIHLRVQAIHFVNLSNIIDQVMRVIKTILPPKMVGKIHSHTTYDTLLEHTPREYLPSNYGGTERSLEELFDEWCEQIEESEGVFKKLLDYKLTKKIELDPYQQDLFGIGVEGSFKKLVVD